ncbi:MAG: NTPase [Nitrospirota bacterium]
MMATTKKNIIITGQPGIGKTTLIKRLSEELKAYKPAGFYTAEIREEGDRKGFELVSLDGRKGLLSHVEIKSPFRVGKYGVDVRGFEEFLDFIHFFELETGLVIIDEIGKMECFSNKFIRLLKDIFNSEKIVIATIAIKGGGFIAETKNRQDVLLFKITCQNRDSIITEVLQKIDSMTRKN